MHQLADQRIDLLQAEWSLWATFQIAANEAIFLNSHVQRGGAGFLDGSPAVLFGQRENAQDAADANFPLLAMDGFAECADVRAGAARSPQQLRSTQRGSFGVIFGLDAIPAAFLAHVFAQQLAGFGIEQADEHLVPLHAHHAADPARRGTVVRSFDFDATIQVDDALAVLVIAKRLDG